MGQLLKLVIRQGKRRHAAGCAVSDQFTNLIFGARLQGPAVHQAGRPIASPGFVAVASRAELSEASFLPQRQTRKQQRSRPDSKGPRNPAGSSYRQPRHLTLTVRSPHGCRPQAGLHGIEQIAKHPLSFFIEVR